MNEKPS